VTRTSASTSRCARRRTSSLRCPASLTSPSLRRPLPRTLRSPRCVCLRRVVEHCCLHRSPWSLLVRCVRVTTILFLVEKKTMGNEKSCCRQANISHAKARRRLTEQLLCIVVSPGSLIQSMYGGLGCRDAQCNGSFYYLSVFK